MSPNVNREHCASFCFCRSVLDFDFEKLCSISLSHINVYACLICGKYFQGGSMFRMIKVLKTCCTAPSIMSNLSPSLPGRGLKSHAYTHSVQFTHHVFLNLHTLKFYCLPDNYEIIDSSLEDVTVGERTIVQDGPNT